MQSLIARKALHKSVRGFASSATRAQAVPLEKPVLVKEFKIYRWVRVYPLLNASPTTHSDFVNRAWIFLGPRKPIQEA